MIRWRINKLVLKYDGLIVAKQLDVIAWKNQWQSPKQESIYERRLKQLEEGVEDGLASADTSGPNVYP